jgi:hypothetical protein
VIKTFEVKDEKYTPKSYSKKVITKKEFVVKKENAKNVWNDKLVAELYRETKDGYQSNDSVVAWKAVDVHSRKRLIVNLAIPDLARTIRNGSTIDVSFEVHVDIAGGFVSTTVPVTILHPLSFVESLPGLAKGTLRRAPLSVSQSLVAPVLGLAATPEPAFTSNVTLADVPETPREPDTRPSSTFKRRTVIKPIITAPSPVSLQQKSKLSVKKPAQEAPTILNSGARRHDYDEVSVTPLDLDEEIDKLYQLVQASQ